MSGQNSSTDRLSACLDLASEAFVGVNAEHKISAFNRAAERLFGAAASEALGQDLAWLQPDGTNATPSLVRLVAGDAASGPSMHTCRAEGDKVQDVPVRLAQLAGGEAMLCFSPGPASSQNQGIEEREAHINSVLATVPDAMIEIDTVGVIQEFSPAAERLFGFKRAEIMGQNISRLMPEPYRTQHDRYLETYLATGERRIIGIGRVVVGQRADLSTFPMELTVGEVRTGSRHFFIGFVRDITERQEVRKRLQELQSELIHMSRITTLGEMASTLAHEINQPLSAIANYLQGAQKLLADGDSEALPRAADALARATRQTLRLGEIIRNMRGVAARGDVGRQNVEVASMIEEACALALVGAASQSVRVSFDIAADLPPVHANAIQIQQVLLNLVRNAMDAMEVTSPKQMNVAAQLLSPDRVIISVSDTGPGLDPEASDHLFQSFFTTKPGGLGVGLSISRTIVEAHGGRIFFTPLTPQGTKFSFTLPLPSKGDETAARARHDP
ncbi:MAG: PAS domain S-box protein [Hyphomicrobiales bacterium]|nr:PAS domain S-box protein [Hyphomicrobiales bacterium]